VIHALMRLIFEIEPLDQVGPIDGDGVVRSCWVQAGVPQDQATPAALKAQLISEVDRWAPIIHAAGQFAD
jgi:hypothetical protein